MNNIFNVFSIDRAKIHWEDYLHTLTPVEEHYSDKTKKTCLFKREDYFAPLGYGGINGSKMRQAVYLGDTYIKNSPGRYVVGGMSCHSPQLMMVPSVANHYGKESINVIGATTSDKAMKNHEMVRGGSWFGASYDIIKVGYNPALQKRCRDILISINDGSFYLEYGITLGLEHTDKEIYDFHRVGAEQVRNIPDNVTTLVMAAGSCNSCTSVFLGLALYPHPNLKRIFLVGTGPSKIDYLTTRLERMRQHSGLETRLFRGLPYQGSIWDRVPSEFMYDVKFFDTYATKWCTYDDMMPYTFDDIVLHPRYEGKVMTYMMRFYPDFINKNTLFWIVGSDPTIEPMKKYFHGYEGGMRIYD